MSFWGNLWMFVNGLFWIVVALGLLGVMFWLVSMAFNTKAWLPVRIVLPIIGVVGIIFMITAGVTWMCHNDPRSQCT